MAKDSPLWEAAYAAYVKETKRGGKVKEIARKVHKSPVTLTQEYQENERKIKELNKQLRELQRQNRIIRKHMKSEGQSLDIPASYLKKPVYIYVLELENGCWYVGSSRNVEKRVAKHKKGKGALWTKKHKVLRVADSQPTDIIDQAEAEKIENRVTIEYAIKYCAQKVRGGGYCSTSTEPKWPLEVFESEQMCSHL